MKTILIYLLCLGWGVCSYGQSPAPSGELSKQTKLTRAWWQTMEASVKMNEEMVKFSLFAMVGVIFQEGFDEKYKATIRTQEIQDKTEALRKFLQTTKKELIKTGGGLNPKTKLPYKFKEKAKIAPYLKQQAGAQEKKLADYVRFLNKHCTELKVEKLPTLVKLTGNRDFYSEYYQGASLLESLITLSHWEVLILEHQKKILQKFLALGE